jgi:hypothetical protein
MTTTDHATQTFTFPSGTVVELPQGMTLCKSPQHVTHDVARVVPVGTTPAGRRVFSSFSCAAYTRASDIFDKRRQVDDWEGVVARVAAKGRNTARQQADLEHHRRILDRMLTEYAADPAPCTCEPAPAPAEPAPAAKPVPTTPRVDTPQQREADRLTKIADELEAKYNAMSERASGMYGRFQGGQPLLVGHHSYRSAVRDRDRADNATRRAIEAGKEAERARSKAKQAQALADLTAIEVSRTRQWQRSDFQAGDIVRVRDFRLDTAVTGRYRVKRANLKTLTLDGGGGGMDDPKREYARVLSRTRDGVTVTDPGTLDQH